MTYTLEQVQSLQDKMIGKLGDFYSGLDNILGKLNIKLPAPMEFGKQIVSFSAGKAMDLDQGMTKINMIARLDEKGLGELKEKLKKVVKENKADIEIAPAGLEKIISQVGNTDQALQILDASLKGSKAGFTDLDSVSGALTQSLAAIGDGKGSAQEVLDVFFAAQRLGNSSFSDISQYMPSLISGASGMGFGFKEAAGAFAYMTSQGQSAEHAAGMIQSAFTALGNSDVQSKMQNMGVGLTDQEGNMRSMVDIFGQLSALTNGMSEQQKTSLFESLGLNDENALGAFSLFTSDMQSLQEAVADTGNAAGETDAALQFSSNTVQQSTELWNRLNTIGASLGEVMLPAISKGLSLAGFALDGLSAVVDLICGFMTGWFTALQDGNPVIWGITLAITGLTAILEANQIASVAMSMWDSIVTTGKWALAAAQWALNTAFLASPVGWIVLGVSALAGVILFCWQKFEGFRGGVYACWEAIKGFGILIKDYVVDRIKGLLSGLSGLGEAFVKLFSGDFSGAWESAKKGASDILGVEAAKNAASGFQNIGKAAAQAYDKGVNDFRASKKEKDESTTSPQLPDVLNIGQPPAIVPPALPGIGKPGVRTITGTNIPHTDKQLPKSGSLQTTPRNGTPQLIDLKEPKPIRKESAEYTAAVDKLSPSLNIAKAQSTSGKLTEGARKMAAVAAIPLAMSLSTPTLPPPSLNGGTDLTEQTASPMGSGNLPATFSESSEGRTILIDRVCDNIIINVANTDEKGTDEIKGQITKLLDEILMYEL